MEFDFCGDDTAFQIELMKAGYTEDEADEILSTYAGLTCSQLTMAVKFHVRQKEAKSECGASDQTA